MRTYPFEASNGFNWGRFMVGILDAEWEWVSHAEPGHRLVNRWQWGKRHIWVMDLVTGEGAWFSHGNRAKRDLDKTRIRVCPLFEPFLEWLYEQDLDRIPELAGRIVHLPETPSSFYGYRRPGEGLPPALHGELPATADTPVGETVQAALADMALHLSERGVAS